MQALLFLTEDSAVVAEAAQCWLLERGVEPHPHQDDATDDGSSGDDDTKKRGEKGPWWWSLQFFEDDGVSD